MADTARLLSVLWGPWRLSAHGGVLGGGPMRQAVARPPTYEYAHAYEVPGPTGNEELKFQISEAAGGLLDGLLAAQNARTQYPFATFLRQGAGNPADLLRHVSVFGVPQNQSVADATVRDVTFRASSSSSVYRYQKEGVLFDYSIAHPSGVSSAVDGSGVQFVGGVGATQSLNVAFFNPHWPAASITTADAKIQSDADGDFGTGAIDEHTFTQVTSTPSYEFASIAGPITNEYFRLSITAVVGGTFYPACLAWIY